MIQFYTDRRGKHRWRITAENNRIVSSSSQGFATLQKAEENLRLNHELLVKYFEELK